MKPHCAYHHGKLTRLGRVEKNRNQEGEEKKEHKGSEGSEDAVLDHEGEVKEEEGRKRQ